MSQNNVANTVRSNWIPIFKGYNLGLVDAVTPKLEEMLDPIVTGTTGKVKLGDRFTGIKGTVEVQAREVTLELIANMFPWESPGKTKTVTSITRSSTTATVTATAHGLVTGQHVEIVGTDQPEYNGNFVATVSDANTFTYTVAGTPATPATDVVSGAITLFAVNPLAISPPINTDMYSYAGTLRLHPTNLALAVVTNDLVLVKASPSAAFSVTKKGTEDDLWTVMFEVYPDRAQLIASPQVLYYGGIGLALQADES